MKDEFHHPDDSDAQPDESRSQQFSGNPSSIRGQRNVAREERELAQSGCVVTAEEIYENDLRVQFVK